MKFVEITSMSGAYRGMVRTGYEARRRGHNGQ
jgi:hypothetical protein